jgi:hypothetical protein
MPIYRKPSFNEPASYCYTKRQEEIIKQDKLNRQTPFDSQRQWYPADLFILVGFDSKGQPIWERNPRWNNEDGFYIGRRSA